jgi:hypothetical protein
VSTRSAVLAPILDGLAARKAMKGFMMAMMNPLARDDAPSSLFRLNKAVTHVQIGSCVINPFMIELMNPFTCGFLRCSLRQSPDQEHWR